MARYDFTSARLFVQAPLAAGGQVELDRAQANYLLNVLRLREGAEVLTFNGRDGEWRARVEPAGRKSAILRTMEQTRPQEAPCDLDYLFAPLKHARLDYMVQKAVEMGAGALCPVMTRRTQASRVKLERMQANAIEAAEQCGILTIPEIRDSAPLERVLETWPADRLLIFCDEDAAMADPVAALRAACPAGDPPPLAVLIGPEGGFDETERRRLMAMEQTVAVSLGPRILRADTAAVAALAVVQAAIGDWR